MSLRPAPLKLTIGVEIECILRVRHTDNNRDVFPERPSRRRSQRLRVVRCQDYRLTAWSNIVWLLIDAQIPVNKLSERHTDYSKWTITSDESIREEVANGAAAEQGCQYANVEIISRTLTPDAAGFAEVAKVVGLVRGRYAAFVNQSCGLHVHVGNGGLGFPVQTVKKLAQVVVAFEHALDSLHADSRVGGSFCMANSKLESMRWSNPYQRLSDIETQAAELGVKGIVRFVSPLRGLAYNFTNLLQDGDLPGKKTVEFRQHAGSVDAAEIGAWMELLAGLVQFCHLASDLDIMTLTMKSQDQCFNALHLIRAIGKAHLIGFYGPRLHFRPREAIPWVSQPTPPLQSDSHDAVVEEEANSRVQDRPLRSDSQSHGGVRLNQSGIGEPRSHPRFETHHHGFNRAANTGVQARPMRRDERAHVNNWLNQIDVEAPPFRRDSEGG